MILSTILTPTLKTRKMRTHDQTHLTFNISIETIDHLQVKTIGFDPKLTFSRAWVELPSWGCRASPSLINLMLSQL